MIRIKTQRMVRAALLCSSVGILMLCGCHTELMPTPNLYLSQTVCNETFANLSSEFRSSKVDVLYVTDRKTTVSKKGKREYDFGRSASMAYGSALVEIGKDVTWEELIQNSCTRKRSVSLPLSILTIEEQNRFPETPLPLAEVDGKIVIDPQRQAEEDQVAIRLQQEIAQRLTKTNHKEAYLFIHGNFATFEDGVFMTAGFWHFLGRQGIPIAYSWPAGSKGGMLRQYTYDSTSGAFTVYHLKQFLRFLASCPQLEKIHIISHSQGTNVICNAVRELIIEARAAGEDPLKLYKIGNLVLAAPDIDYDVALQRIAAERFYTGVEHVTIYVSKRDKMLGTADWLFQSERLGQLQVTEIPQTIRLRGSRIRSTDIITAEVKAESKGHYYFYTSPAVSSDLILLLRDNRKPGIENGRPLLQLDQNFWKITDKYLKDGMQSCDPGK